MGGIRIQTLVLSATYDPTSTDILACARRNTEVAPLCRKKSKRFEGLEKKVRVSHALRIYAAELKATRYFRSLELLASREKSSLVKCLIH